jgi:UDP-N-acetylglucosamine:LPS N-acetylglucosamine transferase
MLGFGMAAYGDVSNLHYFVSSKYSWQNGLKIYPYLKDSKGPIYMGTNPCFFDKEVETSKTVKDTVLFVPGSAEGLGMGIKTLPKLAEFCKQNNKKLICISGLGKPYNFARKVHVNYKKTMTLFSYVASEDLKQLISCCEVIIGKAGGNMSSEFVSKSGCKIFFESIKGQETDNAEYYDNLGVATNVTNNIYKLFGAIINKPYTPSIYKKGIITKSAVDTIVDTILPYLQ